MRNAMIGICPRGVPGWVCRAPSIGMSGVGAAEAGSIAAGAAQGATAGAALGPYGAAGGAVVGAGAAYYAGSQSDGGGSGGGGTQKRGRFSVSGHRAIMTQLIGAQRWDEADAETKAWFDAGQGTADERRRFQPNGPAVLPDGTRNYAFVPRKGHQSGSMGASRGADNATLVVVAVVGVAVLGGAWWYLSKRKKKRRRR